MYASRKYKNIDTYFCHSQNQICDHKLNLAKDDELNIYRISSMKSKKEERLKSLGNASILYDF